MPKSIYLANPYGFSTQLRAGPLQEMVSALQSLGLTVHEPFESAQQVDFSKKGWAYRVAQEDVQGVYECDGIFAVVNGCPPDEGVMVELGLAMAWKKEIFLFRDDFRSSTDSEEYPLNLMLFASLPEHEWRDYWYESIDAITKPDRTLARWAREV